MPHTYDQALTELAALRANNLASEAELERLVRQVSTDASGSVTVLYSGNLPDNTEAARAVQALLSSGQDIRVVDETAAARFLQSRARKTAERQGSGLYSVALTSHPAAHLHVPPAARRIP